MSTALPCRVPQVIDKALFRTASISRLAATASETNQHSRRRGERMNIPSHKVISNLAHYHSSAASIPLALDEAVRQGQIQQMISLPPPAGAGLTWEPQFFMGQVKLGELRSNYD